MLQITDKKIVAMSLKQNEEGFMEMFGMKKREDRNVLIKL